MTSGSALKLVAAFVLCAVAATDAQSPQTQPLVQAGNLVYLGKFTVPQSDGAGGNLSYGGAALGLGADGQSLYFGCQDGLGSMARVGIPASGGVAAIVEPCRAVPNLQGIKPTDVNGIKLGGSLSWNGRLIVSAYTFYDGSGSTAFSHFAGSGGVNSLTGPYRVGTDMPAAVGGYMGVIPQEWRGLFGGPALTGKCCTSIIWRSSYGPAASVFQPDHVGTQASIPSTMLVGYPEAHQTLGAWDAVNTYYTGTMRVGGLAFPAGTRSLLFVARRGETFCYGDGAQCSDPSNPDKGTHGYPYRHVVLAYDAVDLLAVKHGTKKPWEVLPYTQWTLPEMSSDGTADMSSAVYDHTTRRWFITAGLAGGPPVVHVYEINNAVIEPPTPVEVCGDAIDNDGDGLVDENCTEVCGDGIDNDLDGVVDENCTEVCGDGIDNDLDGVVDENCTEVCGDGIDNDLDGVVDENCTEVCGDGIDNDLDGVIDENCTEVCGDGIDNDLDGVVDENCTEVCGDGIDNDLDGLIDENCGVPPAVPSAPVRLQGSVDGSTVSFEWEAPLTGGAVVAYDLEAGLAPGMATYLTPLGLATSVSAPGIGRGRYYLRVRARNEHGQSLASNEVVVTVGCNARPNKIEAIGVATYQGLVTLSWTDPNGCSGTRYVVSVGTTPGAADVQMLNVAANTATTLLPAGTYHARIAAVAETGVSYSADHQFTVRDNGCAVPRFRATLTSTVSGSIVGLAWRPIDAQLAKADDDLLPVSYVMEVGSVSGATDIGSAPMGRASSLSTMAPAGVYFVRVRPVNACGAGTPSADVRVDVR